MSGINNPISSELLEVELDCQGTVIRDGVRALRRSGFPVASCSEGYFLANNFAEIEDTIDNLRSRMKSLAITANILAKVFGVSLEEELPFT